MVNNGGDCSIITGSGVPYYGGGGGCGMSAGGYRNEDSLQLVMVTVRIGLSNMVRNNLSILKQHIWGCKCRTFY